MAKITRERPICTVLLVSYNHAPYIQKAIESVLSQKTKYEYKIHIFDDASTDGSVEIVKGYADAYSDKIFLFISDRNQGAQENLWKAYKSVDTKYCCLLETDDYWCDDKKLELQIEALEKNPDCSFCSHLTKIININDKYRQMQHELIDVCNDMVLRSQKISIDDINAEPVSSGYMNLMLSRIVRSSVLNLDKIKFKEAFLWDNCQFYYLLLKGKMYFIKRVMGIYQMTGSGSYSGVSPLNRLEKFCSAHLEFIKETNFVIGDRIYQEMVEHINWNLDLYKNVDGIIKNDISNVKTLSTQESKYKKYKELIKLFLPPVVLHIYRYCRSHFVLKR